MATKLKLKKREADPKIMLDYIQFNEILESGNKDRLWAVAQRWASPEEVKDYVHDKEWLEMIVNWQPEGGTPVTKMAKWLKLADKVHDLDDTKEGTITLSDFQAKIIWNRLNSDEFVPPRSPIQFKRFILDFQAATGYHFEEEEPDKPAPEKDEK